MKKFFLVFAVCFCLNSCVDTRTFDDCDNEFLDLVTLEFNEEKHEYVRAQVSYGYYTYTHWAGCQYCKEKKNQD